MINKENYEAYFLDYIEGNLSQKDIDLLLVFVDKHPDLKEELSNYSKISLSPKTEGFDKSTLLQVDLVIDKIESHNLETFAIADFEKQLSDSKSLELSKFVNGNTIYKKEVDLVNKTKLIHDESIIYPEKGKSKKAVPLYIPYYRFTRVAAVLLLMIYFFIPVSIDSPQLVVFNDQSSESNSQSSIFSSQSASVLESNVNENSSNVEVEVKKDNSLVADNKQSSVYSSEYLATTNNSQSKSIFSQNENLETIDKIELRELDDISSNVSNRILTSVVPLNQVDTYYDNNNLSISDKNKYLSPKEFLASVFKKDILKSKSKGTEIKAEDFNNTLASITNDKITFQKSANNTRLLSIQTKNFSFEKKLKN